MVKDAVLLKPILVPVLDRDNLTVMTDTQVNKILIDGSHAKGVECIGSEIILLHSMLQRKSSSLREHLDLLKYFYDQE
jgi:hypothetical protein